MSKDRTSGAVLDPARPTPPGDRSIARRRRPRPPGDPVAWAVGALAVLTAATTLLVNAGHNDGRFAPPLDDVHMARRSRCGG